MADKKIDLLRPQAIKHLEENRIIYFLQNLSKHPMRHALPTQYFIASQYFDALLNHMLTHHISDLHIEPLGDHFRIRARLDGLLHELQHLSNEDGLALISRIKVLSHLDITEQRLPQDGRLHYDKAHLRLSTCPTVLGEKLVIRNLMTIQTPLDIQHLGMNTLQQKIFEHAIHQPQGLILVTGPTGSGKTLTLYTALQTLNQPHINISSIEDPVEIRLNAINQVNIRPNIGLNFAQTLRAMLRQDPDVLMVGEMRDQETTEIALAAAQTGHLVFSTLHTNSALDSLNRLEHLGIARYKIIDALRLIMAQRLVRKLCSHCKIMRDNFFIAHGCEQCYDGSSGRTAIYELIEINAEIQTYLAEKNAIHLIKEYLKTQEWKSLRGHAEDKIKCGITSQAEVWRVLGREEC